MKIQEKDQKQKDQNPRNEAAGHTSEQHQQRNQEQDFESRTQPINKQQREETERNQESEEQRNRRTQPEDRRGSQEETQRQEGHTKINQPGEPMKQDPNEPRANAGHTYEDKHNSSKEMQNHKTKYDEQRKQSDI